MHAAVETGYGIELAGAEADPELERFLHANAEATIFHTPEWQRIIHATYGHECDYWVARSGREIVGVFPVTAVRHPLLGTKMIAMPYQFHSGVPLAANEAIQCDLVERALARARERGARYVEIRHYAPVPMLETLGFVRVDSQLVTATTPLTGLRFDQIRQGHRRNVVYATQHGVCISEEHSLSALKEFRRMHLAESRAMANPQAGWRFFECLHQLAPSSYRLLLARVGDRCVGGLLTLDDGRGVFARYGAGNSSAARRLYVGKALLWRAMFDAAERGCRFFNLGISWYGDAGLIHSKEGWNAATRPVHLYVLPIRSRAPVPGAYFEGFALAKAIWRRLPLPVADWLGHRVTRWVC